VPSQAVIARSSLGIETLAAGAARLHAEVDRGGSASLQPCSSHRAARIPIRRPTVAAAGDGRLAPVSANGIGLREAPGMLPAAGRAAVSVFTTERFS
jgi:hypothetical protein